MEKLLGILLILGGCAGMLVGWYETQKKKQALMRECIRLFSQWHYALEREHLRLYDFLEEYDARQPEVKNLLIGLKALLEKNCYPSGILAWQKVLGEKRREFPWDDEAWNVLMDAGDAFFGANSQESLRCVDACRRRMEEMLALEYQNMKRKWKMYMPVGMLGGVILIILLV